MAKREFNKKVIAGKLILIVVIGLILGISCLFSSSIEKFLGIGDKDSNYVASDVLNESDLTIHYIDVGQGDCTFICFPDGTTMMIDAGTSSSGTHIVNYVKNLGVTTIDYFILTHSDNDHSGSAKKVLDEFEVKTIYRPFQIAVDSNGNPIEYEYLGEYLTIYPSTCNKVSGVSYRNFITAAYTETYTENGVTNEAEVWVTYDGLVINSSFVEYQFTFEFFAPLIRSGATQINYASTKTHGYPTKYYSTNGNNNASPVMLLEYDDKSFLFTGDANTTVESDVMASLSASEEARFANIDVYQAGHHGSSSSSGQDFLNLTTPNYVVVSCGLDNSYEHPADDFVKRIDGYSHSVSDYLLRTDLMGDIVFGFTDEGVLAYTANQSGDGSSVTVYWWYIALGTFIVLTIVIISVKVTTNKKATAKRAVSQTKKVVKRIKK